MDIHPCHISMDGLPHLVSVQFTSHPILNLCTLEAIPRHLDDMIIIREKMAIEKIPCIHLEVPSICFMIRRIRSEQVMQVVQAG